MTASTRRTAALLSTFVRVLAVLGLVLSSGVGSTVYAQSTSALLPDLKSIVLASSDLPGFTVDPSRTAQQDRPDGSVSYDAVYTRSPSTSTGPSEVRLAAARTASGKASAQALSATRDALLGAGWTQRTVPLLGDEAIGFEATGMAAGGSSNVGHGYVFRYGRHLIGAILTGSASTTTFEQALGYAVQMSARLDAMLALAPVADPDPAPAGAVVAAAQPPTEPTVSASAASAPNSSASTANATSPATGTGATAASTAPSATGTGSTAASTAPAGTGASSTTANAASTTSAPTTAASLPPSVRPAVTVATVANDSKLDDAPELQNGFKIGGFSGLTVPDPSGTTFITTTDRGPNGEIKVDGKKEIAFPLPNYTPRIL
jgi:hypothetical protein